MAKTCVELIARVKQLVGRSTNLNSTLDLDTIILDALNEAQIQIVRKLSHILELQVKDVTSLVTVLDQYEYDLSDIDIPVAHLSQVWILDGESSQRLTYINKDTFDKRWPDVSVIASGLPKYYTRRGNTIEFNCPVSSDYAAKAIRVDYCKWAAEFESITADEESELINADYGLILFAWSEALRVLAKGNTAILRVADEKLLMFSEWFNTYKSYYSMQIEELAE